MAARGIARGETPASEPEARLLENYDWLDMDLRTGAPLAFWQGAQARSREKCRPHMIDEARDVKE